MTEEECTCGRKLTPPGESHNSRCEFWIIEPSESEKFFRHLNNGEVVLERIEKKHPMKNGSWSEKTDNFRITITEKGEGN